MLKTLFLIYVILLNVKSKEITHLRNLGSFVDGEKTFNIKKFYVLDQKIDIKEKISYKDGKVSHKIIIETNSGTAIFGSDNLGFKTEKTIYQILPFMKLAIPEAPDVILTLKGVANIKHEIHGPYIPFKGDFIERVDINIDVTIYVNVEYDFGGNFNSIAASAKGTFMSFKSKTVLIKGNNLFEKREINRASGSAVNIHLIGKNVDNEKFTYDHEVWKGWEI